MLRRAVTRFSNATKQVGEMVTLPGGLKVHSNQGSFSSATLRDKYYQLNKMTTDPFLQDFFFKRAASQMSIDPSLYGIYGICSLSFGIMAAMLWRHMLFNPDVYFRRQENCKPMPDRHRQYTYSLPYFNHQLRTMVAGWRWLLIDNEPDYADADPGAVRPPRVQSHKAPWSCMLGLEFWYTIEDPMYTSLSHKNMHQIYLKAGYVKDPPVEEEDA